MRAIVLAVLVLSVACSAEQASEAEPEPRDTVFDPLTDTLERARGVEDTLRQRADELAEQLEEEDGR